MLALATTRKDFEPKYQENRDSIDQNLVKFFNNCNVNILLLPNNYHNVSTIIQDIEFDIIILTGGGSIDPDNTESIDRIQIEQLLIRIAIERKKKIIGICRGMQSILAYFNMKITEIAGHVNTHHVLLDQSNNRVNTVNSYHQYVLKEKPDDFEVLYYAEDNSIEAIKHVNLPILGIMWHPERNYNFSDFDLNLINNFLYD